MKQLGIISGCDHDRTLASANHAYYAQRQDLLYINDIAPTEHSGNFYKLDKIVKFLESDCFDTIFWMDDDAFFMRHEQPLQPFLDDNPSDLIFCKSPQNWDSQGNQIWTYLNSGVFFIRNTPLAKEFFQACLATPLEKVKDWWDTDKYGLFTNGDQDIIVYLLQADERFNDPALHSCLPFEAFNARPSILPRARINIL